MHLPWSFGLLPWQLRWTNWETRAFSVPRQYLCFCRVRDLSTYTCSSTRKGLSMAWGRGPWWTSRHIALSALVRGHDSEAMSKRLNKNLSNGQLITHIMLHYFYFGTVSCQFLPFYRVHTKEKSTSACCSFNYSRRMHNVSNAAQNLDTIQFNARFSQESHLLLKSSRVFKTLHGEILQ